CWAMDGAARPAHEFWVFSLNRTAAAQRADARGRSRQMGLSARLGLGAVDLSDRAHCRPDARARPVHALGLRAAGAVPDRDQFRALAGRPLFLEQARHGIYADVALRDVLFP